MAHPNTKATTCGGFILLMFAGVALATEDLAALNEPPSDMSHELAEGGYIASAFRQPAKVISSPDQIPKVVMRELGRIASEPNFRLAPPGATMRTTRLDRRLRFATISKDFCIVGYDVITRSTAAGLRVVVIHLYEPTYVQPFLVARCLDDCRDIKDVEKAFHRKRLVEYRPTYIDF